MNYTQLKQWEKIEKLEMGVMQDAPIKVAKVLEQMGEVDFTARALGLACRFRGLEMVKTLVERGATFSFDAEKVRPSFRRSKLAYLDQLYGDENYSLSLISKASRRETAEIINLGKHFCGVQLVPLNERLRTLNYLCQNAEKIGFDPDDFLFYAHFPEDREMIELLKNKGAVVPEKRIKMITEGGNNDDWLTYCWIASRLDVEQFIRVMNGLIAECNGKKLHFTELFFYYNEKRFANPDFFKFLLDNFNQSKMNKTKIMKWLIDSGTVPCLEIAAESGWLKQPRKRDEMIQYSTEHEHTECTAWLLDFKNRTADLAAERAKAEKKAERELNENPNSLTALKKTWGFKEKKDGTLVITSYKGNSTVLVVPAEIGGRKVTEIGDWALSPHAPRIKDPSREFRKTITKITLPNGLKKIGQSAFCDLISLESVNIPETVRSIGEYAFRDCNSLKTVIVPEGVSDIEANAFSIQRGTGALEYVQLPRSLKYFQEGCDWRRVYLFDNLHCPKLVVGVPHAPHVEEFCEHNKVKFEYYDA
ncbi:MAG: leucine-rich repeat domain-containing protein [Oscillospiraceae bacterium]|nr:leucine-rich repeat domain-containing protein [Oscillospiraceae bacterium]